MCAPLNGHLPIYFRLGQDTFDGLTLPAIRTIGCGTSTRPTVRVLLYHEVKGRYARQEKRTKKSISTNIRNNF